ncbi:MAG: hypothetical protein WCP28_07900 [Actinomycetes bacterium]
MFPRGRHHAPGGSPAAIPAAPAEVQSWLVGRLPDDWFESAPEVVVDRDEITISGTLPTPDSAQVQDADAAAEGRAQRFREQTRDQRIVIAREAQAKWQRHVAWGVRSGEQQYVFTSLAVPAMTRLRQPERRVLDTLVEAGVARSRAEALAWCVKLVGEHTQDWLAELTEALKHVDDVRAKGPESEED